MKERGMIFNAEMVRAILDGSKTQTRRIVKPQREGNCWSVKETQAPRSPRHTHDWWLPTATRPYSALPGCPYGVVGDRIWVRETWAEAGGNAPELQLYRANYPEHVPSRYENLKSAGEIRWTPSIHMPRWASRITLEITDVRVERLKEISEADARAEGIECIENNYGNGPAYRDYLLRDARDTAEWFSHANRSFLSLWHSIYGGESLAANPWVWVIEFKRIDGEAV